MDVLRESAAVNGEKKEKSRNQRKKATGEDRGKKVFPRMRKTAADGNS